MDSLPGNKADGKVDIEALFNWIEQQPELYGIRDKADRTLCQYRPGEETPEGRIILNIVPDEGKPKAGLFHQLKEIVWVPLESIRGRAYASPQLDSSLNSVVKLMCISTIWDFFTTIPLFQFGLKGPLGIASGPTATVLSFLLLWASNVAGENSTNRTRGNGSKATWSLAAFVLLCTAKTMFSGVGVDLWISSRGIASVYAEQLATEKLAKDKRELIELQNSGADFKVANGTCNELQSQLKGIDRNNNEKTFISLFVRAYGPNASTVADQGLTPNQLISRYGSATAIPGVCRQRDALQALNMEKAKPLSEAIDLRSQAIAQKPALEYLRQYEPDLFAEHFRIEQGKLEWVNGAEAVGQATNQFYSNLLAGNLGLLGFSLFILSIAVILTGAAAIMLYQISLNKQVQASYTDDLREYRDAKLDDYQEQIQVSIQKSGEVPANSDPLDAPLDTLSPISESEAFDARSLRWLRINARQQEDRAHATKLYRLCLFALWRKHLAETGQTYYPKLRNDLLDHYRLMTNESGPIN